MNYKVCPVLEKHYAAMLSIFNHYVENSFAAYPDQKIGPELFSKLLESVGKYPAVVVMDGDNVAGFAFLRAHSPLPVFRQTAELTCFLAPEHTGKGAGGLALGYLENAAADYGVKRILAGISGFNEGSIRFHKKHGFEECGRFKAIGCKFGREFDVVWMEKALEDAC